MKNVLNMKLVSRISVSAILAFSLSSQAIVDIAKVPSVPLSMIVPGSNVQQVEDIPDKSNLTLFYNDFLLSQIVNLPGWDTSIHKTPNAQEIFNAFGVRTSYSKATAAAPQSIFYVGANVGRSGVWEKESFHDAFAFIDGRPLKGLTIKGYGGNLSSNRLQPNGSLDVTEAYRDTMLSKILMEKGADTYIGALAIVRPNAQGDTQANYIRLSRSSLRLNDVIDRHGDSLVRTLDHLRTVVSDEIGFRPSVVEFTDWLVKRSALTLARKEHSRVSASNHNKDNFGIAELVDFGEAAYSPFSFNIGYDVNGLKIHILNAAQNMAKEFNFTGSFKDVFENTFRNETVRLIAADAARLMLDTASKSELKDIGLSDLVVERIARLQAELPFGILSTEDVLQKISMTSSERSLIEEKTTTQTMKLKDGHILSNVLLADIGGTDGLRDILMKTMSQASSQDLSQEKPMKEKIAAQVLVKMKALKTDQYLPSYGNYGPQVAANLSQQLSQKISSDTNRWTNLYHAAIAHQAAPQCSAIF